MFFADVALQTSLGEYRIYGALFAHPPFYGYQKPSAHTCRQRRFQHGRITHLLAMTFQELYRGTETIEESSINSPVALQYLTSRTLLRLFVEDVAPLASPASFWKARTIGYVDSQVSELRRLQGLFHALAFLAKGIGQVTYGFWTYRQRLVAWKVWAAHPYVRCAAYRLRKEWKSDE